MKLSVRHLLLLTALAAPGFAGGPIVLMGIDAEDFGPGWHGPISSYATVVTEMIADSGSPGSGILVIGGGKRSDDDVTAFWEEVAGEVGVSVDFVNGPRDIAALTDLSGYKLVAVASSAIQTPSGGLTNAENTALARRASVVREFVNNHDGALLSTSQAQLDNPYGHLGGLAVIEATYPLSGYADISPNAAGRALGITDDLDVCCWHDEYTRYPAFLDLLATNPATGRAAALGGQSVRIGNPDNCTVPRFGTSPGTTGDEVPIPAFAPLCACVRDDISRAFGCRFITPDFRFERFIPWPIFPGREFSVRYELTAFTDLDGLAFNEALPEEFSLRQGLPTSVEFGPLAAGNSATAMLGFMAPAEVGEFEGQGTLVAADGSRHLSRLSYEVATADPAPAIDEQDDEPAPPRQTLPWWWWLVTALLVLLAWWLAARRRSSANG